jgi:hypothetical protein
VEDQQFIRFLRANAPVYWNIEGRIIPLIAGGSAGPGGGDSGGGDSGGQGDGGDGNITTPAGTAGAPGTGGEPDVDAMAAGDQWPEQAKSLIKKLRSQQQAAEREAREAKRALEERSQAGMSEAERVAQRARQLEQELSTAREQLRMQSMREAFRAAGETAGAADPSAIWMLVDRESVDFGPDGEVLNATALVRDLKRSRPWAFKGAQGPQGSADAAQGSQQRPAQVGTNQEQNKVFNDWFRGAAGRG